MRRLFDLIPKLRAEEALHGAAVVGVGSGTIRNADELQRGWERDLGRRRRLSTRDEAAAIAANAGFRVVKD